MNYGKLTAGTTKTAIDTAKPSEKGEIITYLSRMGDVLLHMFSGNGGFALKVLLLDIIVGHFRCKVLCGNGECRQEISQRAIIFYTKSFLHFLCRVTTKQRTIPLRANAAKPSVIHAALINVLRKPFFGFPQPASGFCAFNKRNTFFNQFLLSSLNGKVALRKCNFFFFRISILGNQIAGITSKHIILDRSLCALACSYHFRDLTKMIRYFYSAGFAGFNSTPDCLIKVLPSFIAEKRHEVPRIPEFNMRLLITMYYKIKLFFNLTDSLFIHYLTSVTFAVNTSSSKSFTFTETDILFSCFQQQANSIRRMSAIVF